MNTILFFFHLFSLFCPVGTLEVWQTHHINAQFLSSETLKIISAARLVSWFNRKPWQFPLYWEDIFSSRYNTCKTCWVRVSPERGDSLTLFQVNFISGAPWHKQGFVLFALQEQNQTIADKGGAAWRERILEQSKWWDFPHVNKNLTAAADQIKISSISTSVWLVQYIHALIAFLHRLAWLKPWR